MADARSELRQFLAEEVRKTEGIYVPVRAGLLRRAGIRVARTSRLHPNPEDEFCIPGIGPNDEIIGRYRKEIVHAQVRHKAKVYTEPIMVQKIRPEGYLILNGHHRWAAAVQQGVRFLPIRIVDLTSAADLQQMYRNAAHDRRVALDLDEVIFLGEDSDEAAEKPLGWPLGRIYRERLRLGVPALFRFLSEKGYDIWVYSSKLWSMDYIRNLFRHFHVGVTGIVTGTERRILKDVRERERLEKELKDTYAVTVHVDRKSLVRVNTGDGTFDEFELDREGVWSAEVMKAFREKLGS